MMKSVIIIIFVVTDMFHSPGSPLCSEEADNIKEIVNTLRSAREKTASTAPAIDGEQNPKHCVPANLQYYAVNLYSNYWFFSVLSFSLKTAELLT
ncbi:hypothetical protein EB796_025126 [Bugula neritina]|uniref:Uncharacterized protein n=1 Tax=Bugula neritina TaxID=10212 RepID=A0A7J7ISQ1_BUGNE|nr:hypothetical protein EB796_025126 [Bugula neritina]